MIPELNKGLSEFVRLLVDFEIEFVVVGAFALAFHGHPRYMRDVDFLVRSSEANSMKLERAIKEFGFASLGLKASDFYDPDVVVQLGQEPNRIDLITRIDGISFDDVWENKVAGQFDNTPVWFISASDYVKYKRAAGRTKDLADAEEIENLMGPISEKAPKLRYLSKANCFIKFECLRRSVVSAEFGAQERTRTFTSLRTLAPEASASTNFTTWAGGLKRYPILGYLRVPGLWIGMFASQSGTASGAKD